LITKKSNFTCIIPARAGSKSLKNKNLLEINNKSLVENTLEFANNLKIFEKIILSSDSNKILNVGINFDKLQFHKRSKINSLDKSTTEDVINEVIEFYNLNQQYLFILEPTAWFRKKNTFNKIIELIKFYSPPSIVSVVCDKSINLRISKNKIYTNLNKIPRRRQEREKNFKLASNFWVVKLAYFRKYRSLISKNPYFIEISQKESIDINSKFDLELAKSYN
tara:strand:+ start:121 stop:786 length:666 start_codon:yes stop_codon:yes gene_type:complete